MSEPSELLETNDTAFADVIANGTTLATATAPPNQQTDSGSVTTAAKLLLDKTTENQITTSLAKTTAAPTISSTTTEILASTDVSSS